MSLPPDTSPSALRSRSYDGGYMRAAETAEEIVFGWLRSQPHVETVIDVRRDARWQNVDVDCLIVTAADRKLVLGEIKSDQHLGISGNWLFELFRVNFTAPIQKLYVPGWSVRSEAEVLYFYAPTFHRIHKIRMSEYRLAHANAVRNSDCRWGVVPTDEIKHTVNAYFPAHYVEAMPSYAVYDLKGSPDG